MFYRMALVAALVLGTGPFVCGGEDASARSIENLIARLGSDSFPQREAAESELLKAGSAALPVIDLHKITPDAELERRLRSVRDFLHTDLAEDEFLPILGQLKKPTEIKRFKVHMNDGGNLSNATDLALKWLADAQSEDGHWDSMKYGTEANADLEQTALAALALLGAGSTPRVGQYKQNVNKALAWLKSRQRADGAYVAATGAPVDTITHALAAMAMAEAAGLGERPEHRQSAQLGADFSVKLQQTAGESRGGFGRTEKSQPDLLTTTFVVMQLTSAKVAGLDIPHECCEEILVFIDRLDDKKRGALRGRVDGYVSPCATIMGCLCRLHLGWRHKDVKPYFTKALAQYRGRIDEGRPDVLINYFAALVAHQQGKSFWENFQKHSKTAENFCHRHCELEGSWDPSGVRGGMGRVATTALIALLNEIYYIYMLEP